MKVGVEPVTELLSEAPALRPLFLRWARAAVKGRRLPESFTGPAIDFEAQRRLELLLKTQTGRTTDGKVYGTLLPMLREPSAWMEVAAALGVGEQDSAKTESVKDFLLRLKWLHPEAGFALETLGDDSEVVRHLSVPENRPNWKTLFASVLHRTQHLPGRLMTLSQLGSDWFNDSKILRSGPLRRQLVLIMAAFARIESEDEKDVLASLGVEANPYTSAVTVFAPFGFWLRDGTYFDFPLQLYRQGLVCQLPAETVLAIDRIDWRGKAKEIATSENAAPLVRFVEAGVPVLYTEGYPNYAVSVLMGYLSEAGVVATHWGDADLDGLNIAALVQGKMSGSRVVAPTVIANPNGLAGIPLTEAQRKRLACFVEQNPDCPFGDSLRILLERGCWYEQESFPMSVGTAAAGVDRLASCVRNSLGDGVSARRARSG